MLGDIALAESGGAGSDLAERHYTRAIQVADETQSLPPKLRAATHLSRLWHEQGKHREARELLAPLVSAFSAERDTLDLRGARELLADLGT